MNDVNQKTESVCKFIYFVKFPSPNSDKTSGGSRAEGEEAGGFASARRLGDQIILHILFNNTIKIIMIKIQTSLDGISAF